MCALFATTYPERSSALVMLGGLARRTWRPDYPWGPTDEEHEAFIDATVRGWGGPVGFDVRAPSLAEDPRARDWWARVLRLGASPGANRALLQMNRHIDIRPILPRLGARTSKPTGP